MSDLGLSGYSSTDPNVKLQARLATLESQMRDLRGQREPIFTPLSMSTTLPSQVIPWQGGRLWFVGGGAANNQLAAVQTIGVQLVYIGNTSSAFYSEQNSAPASGRIPLPVGVAQIDTSQFDTAAHTGFVIQAIGNANGSVSGLLIEWPKP